MSEEDTFRKIKGLEKWQAEIIYQRVWTECCVELESQGKDISGGIPIILLRPRVDEALKPYSWTYDMLFPWNTMNFS